MRPGARVQAAIELVAAIEQAQAENGPAADSLIQNYFRSRRYAGSKDRRAVIDMIYAVLRQRGMLLWRLGESVSPRLQVLATTSPPDKELFEGPHAPELLTEEEQEALGSASELDEAGAPDWARFNVPDWVVPQLQERFGDRLESEMAGLSGRAPFDLRVNALRGTVEDAQAALPEATPGRWAPLALRYDQARPIQNEAVFRDGLVEVQDEGSQVAAMLCAAEPGMQVLDLCAGAGGKALALAAEMRNTGQAYAYDLDQSRLSALRTRAKRADARNIHCLKALEGIPQNFDRVIVDAPCSGSGTWRRSPDLRWRVTPERLDELAETQAGLLDTGARFVNAGGHLVYIVCSILPSEAEEQIAAFLDRKPEFRLRPYRSNWQVEGEAPDTLSLSPDMLLMTPASHGTDGFFVAVLERAD